MDTAKNNSILAMLLLVVTGWSCDRTPDDPIVVESIFTMLPVSGETTTRFQFDASQTFLPADEEHPIIIRYDWQNDGVWDQEYTTQSKIVHRFLKPGTYTIRMEARDMTGIRDTSSKTLVVVQGYSAPYAFISVQPDSANVYTRFLFSAASSYDDEDSTELLMYRWDFEGNGDWDTGYEHAPSVIHQYSAAGKYSASVEVKDPTNRSSIAKMPITVNLLNDSIIPSFTVDGGFSTVTDTFLFDASASGILGQDERNLLYSWDLFNDGNWEALNVQSPTYKQVIGLEGIFTVKLRCIDSRGLYMDTIKDFEVFPLNSLPLPVLIIGSPVGNLQTNFYFNASYSSDRETSESKLKYQWDIDGDGLWDTEFDNFGDLFYQYTKTGTYLVRLKVTDGHEDSVIKSDTVHVYNGQHETGLLKDDRTEPPMYYGTVKIEDLWWMQQNIRIALKETKEHPSLNRQSYYPQNPSWCNQYGGLYYFTAVSYPTGICPEGWRLPTKADFQEMVNRESPNSISPLLVGGSSEMHILMTGYIEMRVNQIPLSTGFGSCTDFWLADSYPYGNRSVWYIEKTKGVNQDFIVGQTQGFSVRCVKSD